MFIEVRIPCGAPRRVAMSVISSSREYWSRHIAPRWGAIPSAPVEFVFVFYPLSTTFDSPTMRHSYLSATIGSTFVARYAGIKLATKATAASAIETDAKLAASVVLT
jgi:hypothetical protein